MNIRQTALPLLTCLILPGLIRAQASTPAAPSAATSERGIYEDIEIMRRIMERKLSSIYAPSSQRYFYFPSTNYGVYAPMQTGVGGMFGFQGGTGLQVGVMGQSGTTYYMPTQSYTPYPGLAPSPSYSVEGVYLKGRGIIFTITVPSLQTGQKVEPGKTPLTEWEKTRRQLRNEKETPARPQEQKPSPLSEVLLKALAENGHHFGQLGNDESLTIVVTVHGETPAAAKEGDPSQKAAESTSTKLRDLELLGDLHQKQGKLKEAVKAFQNALALKPGPKQAASLHRKLAQVYLLMEKDDQVKAELEKLKEALKRSEEERAFNYVKMMEATQPGSQPGAIPLPTKVIISASKKLLAQVGEGKLSFDDFRRQIRVETLTFDGGRR
jgi:hypothetical protein